MRGFQVGDEVASLPVGKAAGFTGVITLIARSGKDGVYYHVRDKNGVEWHRDDLDVHMLYKDFY